MGRQSRRTYAIYVTDDNQGWLRLGTIRASGTSAREVSASIFERLPNLDRKRTEAALVTRKMEFSRFKLDPA